MAKAKAKSKRRGSTGRSKRARPARSGSWLVDGVLLIVCATAIVYFTPRSWRAARVAVESVQETAISAPADLRAEGIGEGRVARVAGVPDYGHAVRGEDGSAYFRMAELSEGLLVRAPSLTTPETLEEVLEARTFAGPTVRLASLAEASSVTGRFLAQHRLRIAPGTIVLLAGERLSFPYAEVLLNVVAIVGLLLLVERRFG